MRAKIDMKKENISFLQDAFPPDWRAMKAADAERAVDAAMNEARANLDKIRAVSDGEASFENTVRALDRATLKLDRVWLWLNHLQSVADTPELRAAVNSQMEKVCGFFSSLSSDSSLYGRAKAFAASASARELDAHARKLTEETLKDFESAGANLPPEDKAELMKLEAELSAKTQKFSENVLDATKAFEMLVADESDLAGLPESARELAAKKARERGKAGWLFTLEQPSYVPFITYSESAALRERMWRASANLAASGEFSNEGLMREILSLRSRKAKILGRANFADLALERRMAKSGANADAFVERLRRRFAAKFEEESKELSEFAESLGMAQDGLVRPYDAAYLAEKLRRKKYDFDEELLRPYFPLDSVLKGMFEICRALFGVKISKCDAPANAWDDSVEMYSAESRGRTVGIFYTDFFPRRNKRSGAWMNLLSPALDGRPALGVIAANVNEPAGGRPALLSHGEVETLFHEFGHLMHFFLMDSPELGLRDVAWDFVELPSQLMENWTRDRRCLDMFAAHWKDGSKIPDSLFERFSRSAKFMGATAAMRQLSFAHIDLALHMNPDKFLSGSVELEARRELCKYSRKYSEPVPTILPRFTHLFGDSVGYAAGYYSYKWAEALDADAFTRFKSEGLLNPKTGADYVEKILRVGGSVEPDVAFRNFMGRDPDIEALVLRSIDE
ncbi:MAG: oligopeptidase A [Verrucomicrobia bacterium]|nr:MAG: oligopeptidase A [Verrucomicrobiota bacterium]